jgi:hypothetical protein
MKSPVAIALIIVGGILILGPAISDHLARNQVVKIMTSTDMTSVNLKPAPMSPFYRGGCIVVGFAMVLVAISRSRDAR